MSTSIAKRAIFIFLVLLVATQSGCFREVPKGAVSGTLYEASESSETLAMPGLRAEDNIRLASEGPPLAEATVRVTDSRGMTKYAVTDENGRFFIDGLYEGTATISLSHSQFEGALEGHVSVIGASSVTVRDTDFGKAHYVLVGINDYSGLRAAGYDGSGGFPSFADLAGPLNDVRAVKEALVNRNLLVSEKTPYDSTTVLTDGAATKAGIVHSILGLIHSLGYYDSVVFYFSGHGYAGPEFWADGTTVNFIAAYDGLMSDGELRDALAQLNTPNVVVIIDSCQSGSFIDGQTTYVTRSFSPIPSVQTGTKALRGTPYTVLTAAGSGPYPDDLAYEDGLGPGGEYRGWFSYLMVEAINDKHGTDRNHDGALTAGELFASIRAGITQTVDFYVGSGDPVLYRYR